ncbi:hypothetical protein HAX54_005506 [Datura stramonium]|uniref:Uncharacterized protein n=1 Tax=Datura stramonium TaxID=4076 RepID=A0ABS8T8W9_DATST|nr:hypothetical protein [Datura stramonium]
MNAQECEAARLQQLANAQVRENNQNVPNNEDDDIVSDDLDVQNIDNVAPGNHRQPQRVEDVASDPGIAVEDDIEQEVPAKSGKLVVIDDIHIDVEKSTSTKDGILGVKGKGKGVAKALTPIPRPPPSFP